MVSFPQTANFTTGYRVGAPQRNSSTLEKSSHEERIAMYRVDITADLNDEDHTGYVWTFLDQARDPARLFCDDGRHDWPRATHGAAGALTSAEGEPCAGTPRE